VSANRPAFVLVDSISPQWRALHPELPLSLAEARALPEAQAGVTPETVPEADQPVPYLPNYYTPEATASVAQAAADDIGPGPVPFSLTSPGYAVLEEPDADLEITP
jgi:hypothetical protein